MLRDDGRLINRRTARAIRAQTDWSKNPRKQITRGVELNVTVMLGEEREIGRGNAWSVYICVEQLAVGLMWLRHEIR